ncbi:MULTISPECIES: DUF192 domain-containing protein [unclassified Herbaspirillum]|uniref:DUF192 domain-containing protein n=1 Tax=unclassified Herbaspirillum TaxID=2624150 RepID=UPI00115460EF|nr:MULTISPECIES: DUF192 domain-containing protein [unclassified Herbaspirillum]MBB5391781.1 hypothetical protein [Herbaspirillum sp. SJZ102]TQK02975.1 hypothetical protein FB599_3642 [Herbaspirillum sp. SJZ130]TQK06637.1 hypothetical protein FB598_3643 [Herbaspirillum sp. SJZ106]TWC71154.1 hypothetical protein FB597_101124 [Herbaspirillum sp. SJZ099]
MRQLNRPRLFAGIAATLLTALCLADAAAQTPQQVRRFPTTQLNIGIHLIKAEVAQTEAEREQGLMFREKMGDNEGMLFLFGAPAGVCMWMKNTLIPLSVAFMDEKGEIINIEEMKEQTLDSHCAKRGAVYALEMNKGWFKQKNIKPGAKIEGLPR